MNGLVLMIIAIAFYAFAYRFYGKFISKKFEVDNSKETPAHSMYDGVDYVPAKPPVLLGHHFASIAGAGPIIGPVLAIGFGWLPVYAWILLGAVFMGGVHDYSSIVASVRHKSKSIGFVIESYIGISGKKLFLIFTWATLVLVIAVFALVVADTFVSIPSAGTSSILFIALAILFGLTIYRLNTPLWIASSVGVILLFIAIVLGNYYPVNFDKTVWIALLFIYITIASVTPVWILLQPRDYLNSFLLYALILGGVIGLFFASPILDIPAYSNFELNKIGFLFPALFVTVACGAISGFHSIVGSGTTSKQLDKETDARFIGYGGMLIEGILAILALVAAGSIAHDNFLEMLNTEGPVTAFSIGVANFIDQIPFLNISIETAKSFVALAVAAFALTTLDTATRLARYSFQEFFETQTVKSNTVLKNRFTATLITVVVAFMLTLSGQTMSIWPVFGSANQLLAALALLAITVWVSHLGKKYFFSLMPMLFMFAVTLSALVMLFYNNLLKTNNVILAFVSLLLFVLAVILGYKAYTVLTLSSSKSTTMTS